MLVNSFGGVNTWTPGWWIFYVAPFVGAGLAALTYKGAFAEAKETGETTVPEESHPAAAKDVVAGDEEEVANS